MTIFALFKAPHLTRVRQALPRPAGSRARLWMTALLLSWMGIIGHAQAQETICARVKIQILQQLTMERQGFDAEMKIINTLADQSLSEVNVVVKVTDEAGVPVPISYDPNNVDAKFFIRISNKTNISDVEGTGVVSPNTTSTVNWLLIPAPGAAANNPLGKKYLIGATLKYKFGAETHTVEVSPDVVTVKPLPQLTLDYFLTKDVVADDPMTEPIEPIEPFTLGVRVKNSGAAAAKSLKIDSAQPKIVENNQGLLINFKLTGSYVNDAPVTNSLLIDFGDIQSGTSKIGRWIMETTLAGTFVEFTAKFTHADELGGALTSLISAVNTHFLLRDVRVDLPGRDYVRDFLALDGDVVRVYESDGLDAVVTNLSSGATLSATTGTSGNAVYRMVAPQTAGFVYVKLRDPFNGQKALGQVVRSDAKLMLPENVWLSKTKNKDTKQWEYWINFFDVNTTGVYNAEFNAPPAVAQPPLIQFVPDRVVKEGKQVAFLVDASSPDGRAVTLSAAPLPTGATFVAQSAQVGLAKNIFDWTPAKGQAGNYLITYTASDGALSATRTANIKVEVDEPPPGPMTPLVVGPLADAHVTSLKPALIVQTGTNELDPTTKVQFEVYADSAMTQLVESGIVDKGITTGDAGTTSFALANDLNDNTRYWWRARAFDGTQVYSPWVNNKFFVNLFNNAPDNFNLTNPVPSVEVASMTPVLTWTNSVDRDEDAVTYSVYVYNDAAMAEVVTSATGLTPGAEGSTSWTVDKPLTNHAQYYWRVVAADSHGATTPTPARPFIVNIGNTAPTVPAIQSPAVGGQTATPSTALVVVNSTDAENDLITYVFELDIVNTFDSGSKQASGQVIQSAGGFTSWTTSNLVENKRYYWRVKAQDGRAETDWVVGNFLMNAVNEPPPAATVRNPGDGAWVATRQPSLEANAVEDPEGEQVQYQFEVYRDLALTQKIAEGVSNTNAWIVPVELNDKTTHYWRLRAADPHGAASVWTAAATMYVSTGPYVDPTIAVTAPATAQSPVLADGKKTVTIRWEGTDPNIEPIVALYYDTRNTGYAGTLIVDGLKQSAGTQSGSYVWDVTTLPAGSYYVYAVIYDSKGMGRAYASGAVVIAPPTQSGFIVVDAKKKLTTGESGKKATFTVKLGRAPTANVTVPVSSSNPRIGYVEPASLIYTPQNWNVPQTVTVSGADNCAPNSETEYQVRIGKAFSVDPNYIDVQAAPVSIRNMDNDHGLISKTTNSPNIHLCNYRVVSERKVDRFTWEYALTAELTNTGANVSGVTATLRRLPLGIRVADTQLIYGAVGSGDTVKGTDTFVLQTRVPIPKEILQLGIGFRWDVTTR